MIVFFDLDDTLIDHENASSTGAKGFYREHASVLDLSYPGFIEVWKRAGQLHMERYFRNEVSYQEQRRARVREVFAAAGLTLSDREADERFAVYLRHYETAWRLFDDVLPCLNALDGQRLGVISNGDAVQQMKKLRWVELDSRFDPVVFSGEISVAKPEPGIFIEAARRAGVKPSACIYIGDRLETDAIAATDAGMKGIWLNRRGAAAESLPVPVVSSLSGFPALVRNL